MAPGPRQQIASITACAAVAALLLSGCAPEDADAESQPTSYTPAPAPSETTPPTGTEDSAAPGTTAPSSPSGDSSDADSGSAAGSPSAEPSPTEPSPSDPSTAEPTAAGTAPADDDCADLTGEQAVQKWGPDVPLHDTSDSGGERWEWGFEYATVDDYDPCADLSSISLPIERGTASSPYAVMLFHDGEYLGTATAEPQGYAPLVERLDDATLQITYRYETPGDHPSMHTSEAVSQFRWDPVEEKVQHSGEFPPDA